MESLGSDSNRRRANSGGDFSTWSGREWCGVGLIVFAGFTFALLWMDRNSGIPFDLPSAWFRSKLILFVMALLALPASYLLMRKSADHYGLESPPVMAPNFRTFRFYTRKGCPLCDEALELVRRYENVLPEIEVFDVDTDPELQEKFNTCVPVVEIDGKVRFRGLVNEVLLRRQIDAATRNNRVSEGQVVPLQVSRRSSGS
ncbi:MAG: hypothetical protein CMJ46_06050 [Planctomyces sp.]|nr:hypothetical protein [Planctomyces sp.]